MRMSRSEFDKIYIREMLNYIQIIYDRLEFVKKAGLSLSDEMVIDSLAMNLGQIGEQLGLDKLSEEVKEKYSHIINWRELKSFRNEMYHDYGAVDSKRITSFVLKKLPTIEANLNLILRELEKND